MNRLATVERKWEEGNKRGEEGEEEERTGGGDGEKKVEVVGSMVCSLVASVVGFATPV